MHEGDAIEWLKSRCATHAPPLDLVFVDAFDGDNNVPDAFTDAGRVSISHCKSECHTLLSFGLFLPEERDSIALTEQGLYVLAANQDAHPIHVHAGR